MPGSVWVYLEYERLLRTSTNAEEVAREHEAGDLAPPVGKQPIEFERAAGEREPVVD